MKKIKSYIFVYVSLAACCALSCNKQKFLDEKPSSDITVPRTLPDCQALLDNEVVLSETPVLGELSSDNYYLIPTFWNGLKTVEHNGYIWKSDIFEGEGNIGDWNLPYKQVFYANVVLDALEHNISKTATNEQQWNKIKGAALFIRAYAFYNLAQVFAPVYDNTTANKDLGIPLRLTPNVNEVSARATNQETYQQIIVDLKESAPLLPEQVEVNNRNRPSRPAAFAMLARVYLSMRVYDKAEKYSDSCLKLYDKLIDYNSLDKVTSIPFSPKNDETLYQSKILTTNGVLKGLTIRNSIIDSTLRQSYEEHDLRDTIYFTKNSNGLPILKGSYNGSIFLFSGLATDEVYLTRAECLARAGNVAAAIKDLNKLLITRWETGTFTDFTVTSAEAAKQLILTERRKELAFRGLRWTDIRRLNKEGANITLARKIGGQDYDLPANDLRFTMLIPPDVMALNDHLQQNPR